ncbi:MAG: Gfo/Idh/MocA family oxidoreductase [Dehalococcoidia bacterium]
MVNVGIIGCGYWGPKHARNFHELEEANLTLVCDLEEERLHQLRTQYPYVATTRRYQDLLDGDVEAVVIATPVGSHYRLTREALLHDKHVLVEKPITTSSQEALELAQLAQSRNRVLMVGHTYEYHPAVDFLRQLIKSGELGEIYYIDTARLNLGLFRPDVNVLWDLAPHDASIVLSLLDEEPIAVSARGSAHITPDVCDVAYVELRFPGEALAHIHVSWLDPCKVRQVIIVGSKKMVVYDDVSEAEKIRIYDKGVAIPADDELSAWPPRYRYGSVTIPFIPNTEPLRLECSHFLQCITEGKRPRSDGWAGLKVVNIIELANRSLENGGQREALPPATALAETWSS